MSGAEILSLVGIIIWYGDTGSTCYEEASIFMLLHLLRKYYRGCFRSNEFI